MTKIRENRNQESEASIRGYSWPGSSYVIKSFLQVIFQIQMSSTHSHTQISMETLFLNPIKYVCVCVCLCISPKANFLFNCVKYFQRGISFKSGGRQERLLLLQLFNIALEC